MQASPLCIQRMQSSTQHLAIPQQLPQISDAMTMDSGENTPTEYIPQKRRTLYVSTVYCSRACLVFNPPFQTGKAREA